MVPNSQIKLNSCNPKFEKSGCDVFITELDLIPGFATFFACLFWALEYGILIGVAVQLIFVLYFVARPTVQVVPKKVRSTKSKVLEGRLVGNSTGNKRCTIVTLTLSFALVCTPT